MEEKSASDALDDGIGGDCQIPALLESSTPKVTSPALKPLPTHLLNVVGDYLSDNEDDSVKYAVLGEQPITLCLSQDVNSKLASYWEKGFLPPERNWREPTVGKVDKELQINDHGGCLDLLAHKNSNYYRVVIDVLVVNLIRTTSDSLSALDNLRRTMGMIQGHLNSVKRVVISITEYASYCFSLQGPIDKSTGLPQLFDHQEALCQIFDDLQTCWQENPAFTVHNFLAFYFGSDAKPASEKYLEKFVILITHPLCRDFFEKNALNMTFNMASNKLMWVTSLVSVIDFDNIDSERMPLSQVIIWNTLLPSQIDLQQFGDRLENASCYQENHLIERIIINTHHFGRAWKLPRPSGPLTNTTPLSALIELTLEGDNVLHLTQLNSGYFHNLTHLSVIGGSITGHLDSQSVPRLKTLILDVGSSRSGLGNPLVFRIYDHTQSLINGDLPWQLVASKSSGGWSLATYDELTINPQDEEKDDSFVSSPSSRSQPRIKELMLVIMTNENAQQWQSQLKGNPSLEAAAEDHKDNILVWSPKRVEKIVVFGTVGVGMIPFEFVDAISGQTSILSSLVCNNIKVKIDGAALLQLQSLELKGVNVQLSGNFPQLITMCLIDGRLQKAWQIDAPKLQSLDCICMWKGKNLTVRPELLPHLSFLRIDLGEELCLDPPKIILSQDDVLGLSSIRHVDLGRGMVLSPLFNQFQLHRVVDLTLAVELSQLPAGWSDTPWQCETLKIGIFMPFNPPVLSAPQESILTAVLPPLPCVTSLLVVEEFCKVLLDREMPNLTDCSVNSPTMFGPNLKCPALKKVHFTGPMRPIQQERFLHPDTYRAIGAQPRFVYFEYDDVMHMMDWDNLPNENELRPLIELLKEEEEEEEEEEEVDDFSMPFE